MKNRVLIIVAHPDDKVLGCAGKITNISSDLALIAPGQRFYMLEGVFRSQQPVKPVTYSIAKSRLLGLIRYLSTYWFDRGVRCNEICQGGVENGKQNSFFKGVSLRIPMGGLVNVNKYQSTLIWMISDASSYPNRSIISVEGGRTS